MNSSSSGSSYQTAEGVLSHQSEQRDPFDFAYRPNLDGNLLAKHAGQNFNKDKVFCDFD
jgi:hypothetical protein